MQVDMCLAKGAIAVVWRGEDGGGARDGRLGRVLFVSHGYYGPIIDLFRRYVFYRVNHFLFLMKNASPNLIDFNRQVNETTL